MFERLAGKFLTRLLSKYFVSNEQDDGERTSSAQKKKTSKRKSSSSSSSISTAQLGVWSGFVSLDNLEVRVDVINQEWKRKGIPFELLQCTLGRVEMTVPWAKLGFGSGLSGSSRDDEAVVVIVVDGLHALLKTTYEFDDAALRAAAIEKRRQGLLDSELFGKDASKQGRNEPSSGGLSGFLQKRLAEGLLKDIMEKLHIHLRDVHVRMEDVNSDPSNPFACGLTLESLHIQADGEIATNESASALNADSPDSSADESSNVIRKVAQLNHMGVYWNPLAHGQGLQPEHSILHQTLSQSSQALTQALDRCIARRTGSSLATPMQSRTSPIPLHSYLLLPLDATCHVALSTTPNNLDARPALVASLHLDDLSLQVRDFQCAQILTVVDAVKEHTSTKEYRKYRPLRSAKDDPKAWWNYLINIIRMELRESNMRWSWRRFHQRHRLRHRYCELYERHRGRPLVSARPSRVPSRNTVSSVPSQNSISEMGTISVTADEGAGPSLDTLSGARELFPLSQDEMIELKEIEDGIRGDLGVKDIVLFRALVNARIAERKAEGIRREQPSRLRNMMRSMISEDMESEEEYERLMAYLESASSAQESSIKNESSSLVAVSIQTYLERGCVALFAPLASTEDLDQHRRIQHRFLELAISTFHVGYLLRGNYESFGLQVSLDNFIGTEIRKDMVEYTFISRKPREENGIQSLETSELGKINSDTEENALFFVDVSRKPLTRKECDTGIKALIEPVEVELLPEFEWPVKLKQILLAIPFSQSSASFWEDISMAKVNSMRSRGDGLIMKAEAALFKQKNLDLDIQLNCPIIRMGDVGGSFLLTNLGRAHLTTERLAGVAIGKLSITALSSEGGVTTGEPSTSTTLLNPSAAIPVGTSPPRRKKERWSFGSAATIDSDGFADRSVRSNRSMSGPDPLHLPFTGSMDEDDHRNGAEYVQSSFYDTFQLRLSNMTVLLNYDDERVRSRLLENLDAKILIQKSVLPADHTLSKMKAHCTVENVAIEMSEAETLEILQIVREWNGALSSDPSVQRARSRSTFKRLVRPLPTKLHLDRDQPAYDSMSDSSSLLDENQFIDALENPDEEGSSSWFEERWLADTESVLESEVRSIRPTRRYRRASSISDVSSISERSLRKQRWLSGDYLSAENLARLEEQGNEDDSLGSSESEDSFESAWSLGGRAGLADALRQDIIALEDEICSLAAKMDTLKEREDPYGSSSSEVRTRSLARKGLKLQLDRSQAELRAMKASHQELTDQLVWAEEIHYDEQSDQPNLILPSLESQQDLVQTPVSPRVFDSTDVANRVKALLKARKQRLKHDGPNEAFQHSLTSNLNRELCHVVMVLSRITVRVKGLGEGKSLADENTSNCVELCLKKLTMACLKRTNECRWSTSIDHGSVSFQGDVLDESRDKMFLCYGGTHDQWDVPLLSSLYPQHLSSSMAGTKLARLALNIQDRKKLREGVSRRSCISQLRVLVGDVELCPAITPIAKLTDFAKMIRITPADVVQPTPSGEVKTSMLRKLPGALPSVGSVGGGTETSTYLDASVHWTSGRIRLGDSSEAHGAITISETSVRCLRADVGSVYKTRSQVELKCGNIQVLETNQQVPGSAFELLGRRDPYQPLLTVRTRSQLVPASQLGGWVTEGETTHTIAEDDNEEEVLNVHVGIRANSACVTPSTKGVTSMSKYMRGLVRALQIDQKRSVGTPQGTAIDNEKTHPPTADRRVTQFPLRWRIDVLSIKSSVVFTRQAEPAHLLPISDALGNSLMMPVSFHFYVEEAPGVDIVGIRGSIPEISLLRSADDWPLLEPVTVRVELSLPLAKLSASDRISSLEVPINSTWCYRPHRLPLATSARRPQLASESTAAGDTRASVSVSPVRFNLSPENCILLRETCSAVASNDVHAKTSHPVAHKGRKPARLQQMIAVLSIDSLQLRLLREGQTAANIESACSLALCTLEGTTLSLHKDILGPRASLTVKDMWVDDLSVLPGIRVVAREHPFDPQAPDSPSAGDGHFVQLHISSSRSGNISVGLQWDRTQCLVLPSLLRSLLTFSQAWSSFTFKSPHQSSPEPSKTIRLPLGGRKVVFTLRTKGFECIFPSTEVPVDVKRRTEDSLSVVNCRWSSMTTGKVFLADPEHETADDILEELTGLDGESQSSKSEQLQTVTKDHLDFAMRSEEGEDRDVLENVLSMKVSLKVDDFQILRTSIRRLPLRTATAGDPQATPHRFSVRPPSAGEQRITSPFGFEAKYRMVCAFFTNETRPESNGQIAMAQSLDVSAGFIDALLYIRQSAGGIHDAIRVTIAPIQDIVRTKDSSKPGGSARTKAGTPRLLEALQRATAVCAVRLQGVRVTCVPGGATRLTESPIIKFTISEARLGLAVAAVSTDSGLALSSVNDLGLTSKSESLVESRAQVFHTTAGGWLAGTVSASYHNRRLVAWEPFVEPWDINANAGVDLVDAGVASASTVSAVPLSFDNAESVRDTTGERLRDIGRLLRSPFRGDSPVKETKILEETVVSQPSDLCYLLLTATGSTEFRLSALSSITLSRPDSFLLPPGSNPQAWLQTFGHPEHSWQNEIAGAARPTLLLSISDARPMNINLTGALIESVHGFLSTNEKEKGLPIVPHLIRNDSGLTIRFQEVLDADRLRDGEKASKITVRNEGEVPLSLKRSRSQSCDPHRAYGYLELGSFEDTAGRMALDEYDTPKGYRATSFFFKVVGTIPLDTVGVHRYVVRRNSDRPVEESPPEGPLSSVGFVIVRVALRGGTKVVSIESPLILKNTSNADIFCELHDADGVSLLWRSVIPKEASLSSEERGFVPVPVDLVNSASYGSSVLTATAAHQSVELSEDHANIEGFRRRSVALSLPPPYSRKSVARGLIRTTEARLPIVFKSKANGSHWNQFVNLSSCGLRIGSLPLDSDSTTSGRELAGGRTHATIPEQRMLLFRPPVVIRNHLPVTVHIQVRLDRSSLSHRSSSNFVEGSSIYSEWESLGHADCGDSVSWTGAVSTDKVELRIKICDRGGEESRQFPSWSSSVIIPSELDVLRRSRSDAAEVTLRDKLKIVDTARTALPISVALGYGSNAADSDSAPAEDIRWFGSHLAVSPRVIALHVPYWIIDATGQQLEFTSNAPIAGQVSRCSLDSMGTGIDGYFSLGKLGSENDLGLAELLHGEELTHLSAKPLFEVFMIGDDKSTRLSIRSRLLRSQSDHEAAAEYVSPWSDPVSLRASENSPFDVLVEPAIPESDARHWKYPILSELLALRSKIINAPERLGGKLGTRLVHVASLYQVVNELGRDIEVATEDGKRATVFVGADGLPVPFHFDDSRPIIFRPKEYGWGWSGSFKVKKKRREVSLRLIHKLKGLVVIVEVELHRGKWSPGYTLVLREASHPPFRLENHTMYPLYFGQSAIFRDENGMPVDVAPLENTLLPYHHSDYAWDEPEAGRRSLFIETTSPQLSASESMSSSSDGRLGRFVLEQIAPGTRVKLKDPRFSAQIVADGPTRVLRITDASLPPMHGDEAENVTSRGIFDHSKAGHAITSWVDLRLVHGVGISVVDWSPEELVYVRLQDIAFERTVDKEKEAFHFSIGRISADNQLWVTPYPVLLKMGRVPRSGTAFERRRRRKYNAITLFLRHTLQDEGKLIILDKVELSVEPVILSVDGHVTELIWRMARRAAGSFEQTNGEESTTSFVDSRDSLLNKALGIADGRSEFRKTTLSSIPVPPALTDKHTIVQRNVGLIPTTAVAMKLLMRPRSGSSIEVYGGIPVSNENASRDSKSIHGRKFYIERFRVSTMKTEISWSGPLPSALISLPAIMRPALTFESLPVMLRPFSSSHSYGTMEDIAQEVKSHYLSIWRVFDVLVGLTVRPTFLIRAVVYTWRESSANAFDSLSKLLSGSEQRLLRLSESSTLHRKRVSTNMPSPGGPISITISFFNTFANLSSGLASFVRYGGSKDSAGSAVQRSIRSRNPRLFEHVDGKDLLVEYVEGENAGKALLSRVRMGRHLGEGYIFHVEDVHTATVNRKSQIKVKLLPLIFMITSERLLLLNGDRDVNFCSVVWEVVYENLVNVEIVKHEDRDLAKLWYLVDTNSSVGNIDERLSRYAHALVGDSDLGLEVLLCKHVVVRRSSTLSMQEKLTTVWHGVTPNQPPR